MRKENSHPSWWLVYVLGLFSIGLLVLGALAHLSEHGHQAVTMGSVLLACGLVEVWLRAERRALLHLEGLTLVQESGPDSLHSAPVEHEPETRLLQVSVGACPESAGPALPGTAASSPR